MSRANVSDEVIDAIAFIEMHRQESEKESGTGAACAEALPKLQALLDQLGAETADPADVHAANLAAVTNDIARVKRLASGGGGGGGGGRHSRPAQKKPMQRQHGQGHAHQGQGHPAAGHGHGPSPKGLRRRQDIAVRRYQTNNTPRPDRSPAARP